MRCRLPLGQRGIEGCLAHLEPPCGRARRGPPPSVPRSGPYPAAVRSRIRPRSNSASATWSSSRERSRLRKA